MTDRPFAGLIGAALVEARHWARLRWEFDDDALSRAWQFTSLAIALAAVLIWLDGNRYTALPSLLSWLPPLLLPLQFVQAYGLRDSLPLGMFSFLARSRRERNQRLGLVEDTRHFNFGNVLFAVTMVAASVGSRADSWIFLPGLVLLTGWALHSAGGGRLLSLAPLLGVAGMLAFAGQIGLERAEEWLGGDTAGQRSRFDPNFNSTLIGSRGTVRQSPDILWRLLPAPGNIPPPLLRTATFNNFLGTNWQNHRIAASDFTDLETRLIGEDAYYLLQAVERAGGFTDLPSFSLRGAASAESPLPLPGDAAALRDFALDGIERNSFGTIRVFPKHPVMEGTVFWKGGTNPEKPPLASEDLQIPVAEREVTRAAVRELGLKDAGGPQDKIVLLRTLFHGKFRYTRDLSIQQFTASQRANRPKAPTPLDRFLNEVQEGHCEYFATAATLMLREAGIPSRYSTGYAVMERDAKRGGFVIRGTHGHAWCRVWDESAGNWFDFDPTPPDWFSTVAITPSVMQRFQDSLRRLREDFFLWRNRPANRVGVSLALTGIGLGVSGFVLKRLWNSKRRLENRPQTGEYTGPIVRTPLHSLEGPARKHLGPRPAGQPFSEWLSRLHLSMVEAALLDEAITLHQRLRFDPAPFPQSQHERLANLTRRLESALKRI